MAGVAQAKVTRFGIIGGSAAMVLAAAALFVQPWEGRELKPYRDIVNVLTVCDGHTGPDIVPGKRYTPAECDRLLQTDLGKTYTRIAGCVTRQITVGQATALLSISFNVGATAICRSTMVRLLNEGAPPSVWCKQFDRWAYAGGRKVRGLVRRREAEKRLCLTE